MRALSFALAALLGLGLYAPTPASTQALFPLQQIISPEVPGPSQALFAAPYYTCSTNKYVATTGSDSNNGNSGTPWLTIAHADASAAAGECINVAPGSYSAFNSNPLHGGSSATSTGYVVYRCGTGPTDFSNMDNCVITVSSDNGLNDNESGTYPEYIIVDGFTITSSTPTSGDSIGFGCWNGNSGTTAACHHWALLNSVVSDYGQSGVQLNDGEYFYVFHNTLTQNSHDCNAAQGSGVSFVTMKPVSGYTPTADDQSNPKFGVYGTSNPYHNVVAFNVIDNNYFCASGAGNTDGNGIIMDSNDTGNGNTLNYPGKTLVAFNVIYNDGGRGVEVFYSSNVTVANNSSYNNNLDTKDNATERPEYEGQQATTGASLFINNVAYSITGSGILSNNSGYVAGGSGADGTFSNNLSYCTVTSPCNQTYNGNPSFSCTSNKCATTASWVNVGNTSAGSESTAPSGTNFALQSGSPAIGYGLTKSYLPAQSIDAGACYHTLTTCP